MDNSIHNNLVSFIWSIADDCLRDVYVRGKYRDVILPMVVLCRLEPFIGKRKKEILEEKRFQEKIEGTTKLNEIRIQKISGHKFNNISDWTLQKLYETATKDKARKDIDYLAELEINFLEYLKGFTDDIKDIVDRFRLSVQIRHMATKKVLYDVLEKFTSPYINLTNEEKVDPDGRELPALSNHDMGCVFEELIRKFNEENNEEAGEHFTPRDIIHLMANLTFEPIKNHLPKEISIYDPACGTGGMLTESKSFIVDKYNVPEESVQLYGVEINDETYAICQSDMLIKGNTGDIICGSTLAENHFKSRKFNVMQSNPPYGKSWVSDMKYIFNEEKVITDPRFKVQLADFWSIESFENATPRSSDGQLLFLMEMVDKMKPVDESSCGSRIASVHNGSSLFTGDAGSGESNIRRYIIENDLLEVIIQLPNNMFYNTGITTYIWVLTNNKSKKRVGKVQLIDASELGEKLRKNLGNKNCQFSENSIKQIMKCYASAANQEKTDKNKIASLVLENIDFGYHKVTIERPKRLMVQFSNGAIDELRYDKTVAKPMKWAYSQYDDNIYSNLNKYVPEIEKWCKQNGVELTTKVKNTLFSLTTWNKGRSLRETAYKLMYKIGEDIWMDYNEFLKIFDTTLKDLKIKLSSSDRKLILGAISTYNANAEKVIKKRHRLSSEKLTELTRKYNCKIHDLADFGYYATGESGIWIEYESENELRDFENIPLKDNIYSYFYREIKPYVAEAWINMEATKIGYEISFNKYFYRHKPLRSIDDVKKDILDLERQSNGLINKILEV